MEHLTVYVLTCLTIDGKGNVFSRNVGVTFDVFVAEAHKGDGVENDFETFPERSGIIIYTLGWEQRLTYSIRRRSKIVQGLSAIGRPRNSL